MAFQSARVGTGCDPGGGLGLGAWGGRHGPGSGAGGWGTALAPDPRCIWVCRRLLHLRAAMVLEMGVSAKPVKGARRLGIRYTLTILRARRN